jgi:hypothetical protein
MYNVPVTATDSQTHFLALHQLKNQNGRQGFTIRRPYIWEGFSHA